MVLHKNGQLFVGLSLHTTSLNSGNSHKKNPTNLQQIKQTTPQIITHQESIQEMESLSFLSVYVDYYEAVQGQVSEWIEQTLWRFNKQRYVCQNNICEEIMVPVMNTLVYLCVAMSVMLFVDRVSMAIVKFISELLGRTPEKRYKWEAIKEDSELGGLGYPMVLVQIPMYNEREVSNTSFFRLNLF